ncbi:MAG: ATP synthase subunit I [Sciscionella sp.]
MQAAAAKVPAASMMSLRRPVLIAAVFGIVALVVAGVLGHIVMGILFVIGLLMGTVNARLLQQAVTRELASANPTRKAVGFASAQRLLLIAMIALALGYFVRPDGLGVFFGLAIFQFIIIGNTALPVMKERRNHE